MKTVDQVDRIMETMPKEWWYRWCGGESGPCACMGCVQIGNRISMAKAETGVSYRGDPEYIDESKISADIFAKLKITREEYDLWLDAKGALSNKNSSF